MLGAHVDEAVVGVADVEIGVEEVEEAWEFDPEFFCHGLHRMHFMLDAF